MNIYELSQLLGAFIAIMGLFNLARALKRRRWPDTVGLIQRNENKQILSSLHSDLRTGFLSYFSSKSYAGTDKEIVLRISYLYAVDGTKYIGNQLYSAPVFKVRDQIGGIKEGTKVKVFYNPMKPQVSFLAHSYAWPSITILVIGIVVFGIATYLQLKP